MNFYHHDYAFHLSSLSDGNGKTGYNFSLNYFIWHILPRIFRMNFFFFIWKFSFPSNDDACDYSLIFYYTAKKKFYRICLISPGYP